MLSSSLWIDSPEIIAASWPQFQELASDRLGSIAETCPQGLDAYYRFSRDGFLLMPNAVSHVAIDNYLEALGAACESRSIQLLASRGHSNVKDLSELDPGVPLTKILDTYAKIPQALELAFSPVIYNFLRGLFCASPMAFQGLHFEVGSTQAVHQDPAYVVVNAYAHNFAATWIALEDIVPGSGELVYYPRSHRIGPFVYDGKYSRYCWNPELDGDLIHSHHLNWLHEESSRIGQTLNSLIIKKGDALVWHSNLAHGGGAIDDSGLTRRSLVTHYCPAVNMPMYMSEWPPVLFSERVKTDPRGFFYSSRYYN